MLKLKVQLHTQYHRSLATDRWLAALQQHLTAVISSHTEFQTADGSGVVRARFNEERLMGPRSLVKDDFEAAIDVRRRGFTFRRDRYEARVRYYPENGSFRTVCETISTVETRALETANRRRVAKCVAKFVKRIRSKWDLEEIAQFKCPLCGAPIDVRFDLSGRWFLVTCSAGDHFSEEGTTNSPPTWWRERVRPPWWLSCGESRCVSPPAVSMLQNSS